MRATVLAVSTLLSSLALAAQPVGGELKFAPPYVPRDVVAAPDGATVLLVDHGSLSLRDARTLKVLRFLAPTLNAWRGARFSADGKQITAWTQDGLNVVISAASGSIAARLADGPVSSQNMAEPPMLLPSCLSRRAELATAEVARWPVNPFASSEPAWIAMTDDAVAVSDAQGRVALHVGRREPVVHEVGEPIEAVDLTDSELFVMTTAGEFIVFDHAWKQRARVKIPEALKSRFLACPPSRFHRGSARQKTLVWLTSTGDFGSMDLDTGRELASRSAGGMQGIVGTWLVDDLVVVSTTRGTSAYRPPSEEPVWTLSGATVIRRADANALSITNAVGLQLVDLKTGRVIRTVCAFQDCDVTRTADLPGPGFALSPSGRWVVSVKGPTVFCYELGAGKEVARAPLSREGDVAFLSDDVVRIGRSTMRVPSLELLKELEPEPWKPARCASGVCLSEGPDQSDRVEVELPNGSTTALVSPFDPDRPQTRGLYRAGTSVVVSPGGELVLLGHEASSLAQGGVQLWTMPRRPLPILPPPPRKK